MRIEREYDLHRIYQQLTEQGELRSPRGMPTLEIENFTYTVAPRVRFNRFVPRKLNLDYIKREFQWYIGADVKDLSIVEYAKIWGPMVKGGQLNSNYGHYWFKRDSGVRSVLRTLRQDPDSRRAVIPMLGTESAHFERDIADMPCTTSVEFRIRDGKLKAHFIMRSQDAVYGMGNDLPTFSMLQEVVATLLEVPMGDLSVTVGSFHVYERHFDMVDQMSEYECPMVEAIEVPRMTLADACDILNQIVPKTTDFGLWLTSLSALRDPQK